MIVVENWLLFLFIMAFAFYLSVPFVAGAIMKGLSGTTAALQAGVQGSLQAAGLVVGAGLTAAGAAATLGGSTAVQAALAGTQAAGVAPAQSRRPDLPDLLKRIYLEPARKKAAAMYQTRNEEFAEKQIHQKVEITISTSSTAAGSMTIPARPTRRSTSARGETSFARARSTSWNSANP